MTSKSLKELSKRAERLEQKYERSPCDPRVLTEADGDVFNSSFETAGFPEWNTKTGGVQTTNPVYKGNYALKSTSSAMAFIKNFGGIHTRLYVRFYARWKNLTIPFGPGSSDIILVYGVIEMFDLYLVQDTTKTVLGFYSNLGNTKGSTGLASNTWYRIDLILEVSIFSVCQVYLDGHLEATLYGDNSDETSLTTVELSACQHGTKFDEQYLDWLGISSTPFGETYSGEED